MGRPHARTVTKVLNRRSGAALALAGLVWALTEAACSSTQDTVESNATKLVITPNDSINPQFPPGSFPGSESAAAIVYPTPTPGPVENLVVANNLGPLRAVSVSPCPTVACGKNAYVGWSMSPAAGASPPFPTGSWIPHFEYQNCNDVMFDFPASLPPLCGTPGNCPCVAKGPPPTMGDGQPYMRLRGDPTLVATGNPNQLALVSLADSTANTAVDVVMAISNDGGNSFGYLTLMTDSTSNGTISGCGAAQNPPIPNVDQPKIVMEGTTSHVGYVYWATFAGSGSSCHFRPFARRVYFPATPYPIVNALVNLDNSNGNTDQMNFGHIEPYCSNAIDNCGFPPSSGPPGDETLTIVWPKLGPTSAGWPLTGNCATNTVPTSTVDVEWHWEVRDLSGGSWYHGDDVLVRDQFDPVCVIPGAQGPLGNNQGFYVEMTQDSAVAPMIHVFLSQSIFFNGTGLPADWRGTRIMHGQINLSSGASASPMEELSPVHSVFGCGGGTCALCNSPPGHSTDECFAQQFVPSAANLGSSGKMAVAWHDTRLTPHSWSDAASSGGPGTGSPPSGLVYPNMLLQDAPWGAHSNNHGMFGAWSGITEQISSGAGVPSFPLGDFGNTPWGDYESMAIDPFTISVYPVWADSRNLTQPACTPYGVVCPSSLFTTQWKP